MIRLLTIETVRMIAMLTMGGRDGEDSGWGAEEGRLALAPRKYMVMAKKSNISLPLFSLSYMVMAKIIYLSSVNYLSLILSLSSAFFVFSFLLLCGYRKISCFLSLLLIPPFSFATGLFLHYILWKINICSSWMSSRFFVLYLLHDLFGKIILSIFWTGFFSRLLFLILGKFIWRKVLLNLFFMVNLFFGFWTRNLARIKFRKAILKSGKNDGQRRGRLRKTLENTAKMITFL